MLMATRMRLSCHAIIGGRFYPAGMEIPPEVAVPGGAMGYAIRDDAAKIRLLNRETIREASKAVGVATPKARAHPLKDMANAQ